MSLSASSLWSRGVIWRRFAAEAGGSLKLHGTGLVSHHGYNTGALAGAEQPEGLSFLVKGSAGEEYCGFTPARGTRGSWVWAKVELHIFLSLQ